MNFIVRLSAVALLIASVASGLCAQEKKDTVYELRTYVTNEGKLEPLNARFRDHTVRLFEKHGIKNIGYWVPTEEPASENTLIYLISHSSKDQAAKNWKAFIADPNWKKVAKASQQDGKFLAQRPDSIYMTATDFSPQAFKSKSKPRLFELRRYTTAEGRLPALLQRFRDGELELFAKHGMTNVAYFVPQDIPNTLIYIVAHNNEKTKDAAWNGFRNDADWKKLKDESVKDGKIVIQVESTLMRPVDYSTLK